MAGRFSKEYRPTEFVKLPFDDVAKALAMKEQQYQQGYMAPSAYKQDMAKVEVRDPDVQLHQQLTQQAVDKARKLAMETYGGDYGAAAQDITRTLVDEASNPFYSWTKAKMDEYKKAKALDMELQARGEKLSFNRDLLDKSYYDQATGTYNKDLKFDVENKLAWEKDMRQVAKNNVVSFQKSYQQGLDEATQYKLHKNDKLGKNFYERTTTHTAGTKLSMGDVKGRESAYEEFKDSGSYAQMKKTLTTIGWNGVKFDNQEDADNYIKKTFNNILTSEINQETSISKQELDAGTPKEDTTKKPKTFLDDEKILNRGDENKHGANSTPNELASWRINGEKQIIAPIIRNTVVKTLGLNKDIERTIISGLSKQQANSNGKFINLGDFFSNLDKMGSVKIDGKVYDGGQLKNEIIDKVATLNGADRKEYLNKLVSTMHNFINPYGKNSGYKFDYEGIATKTSFDVIDNRIKSQETLGNILKNPELTNNPVIQQQLSKFNFDKEDLNKPYDEVYNRLIAEETKAIEKTRNTQHPLNNPKISEQILNLISTDSGDNTALVDVIKDGKKSTIPISSMIFKINELKNKDTKEKRTDLVSFSGKDFIVHALGGTDIIVPINKYTSSDKLEKVTDINNQIQVVYNSKHRTYGTFNIPGIGKVQVIPKGNPKEGIYIDGVYTPLQDWNNMIGSAIIELITPPAI